ncbi:hypothetical protein [Lysobacter gummosus]|uniref:hypothetical protein n=1 Tax=Lysobacter gummosus TaxID=262324 RepID=UPI0036369CF9
MRWHCARRSDAAIAAMRPARRSTIVCGQAASRSLDRPSSANGLTRASLSFGNVRT